jgi:hypothetical protein
MRERHPDRLLEEGQSTSSTPGSASIHSTSCSGVNGEQLPMKSCPSAVRWPSGRHQAPVVSISSGQLSTSPLQMKLKT